MIDEASTRVRIDRWLWAARFFRSRALAKEAIESGRVLLLPADSDVGLDPPPEQAGNRLKPGREIGAGTRLLIRRAETVQIIDVKAVEERRGSATIAATLYTETPASIEAREAERAQRALLRAGLQIPAARPDRRDRRDRMRLKHEGAFAQPASPGTPALSNDSFATDDRNDS